MKMSHSNICAFGSCLVSSSTRSLHSPSLCLKSTASLFVELFVLLKGVVVVDVGREDGDRMVVGSGPVRMVVERGPVHVSVADPMNGSSWSTSSVVMTGSVIDTSVVDSVVCVNSPVAIGVLAGGGAVLDTIVCPSGVFAR
jgi:hypothetical protein